MIDSFSKNIEQSSEFQDLLIKIISSIDSIETSPKSVFSAFEAEAQRSQEICNRLLLQLDSASWRILNVDKFELTEIERQNLITELAANIMNDSINARDNLKKFLALSKQVQKGANSAGLKNTEDEKLDKEISSIVTLIQTMQNLYGDDNSFDLYVRAAEDLRRQIENISRSIQVNVDYLKDINLSI